MRIFVGFHRKACELREDQEVVVRVAMTFDLWMKWWFPRYGCSSVLFGLFHRERKVSSAL